MPLISVIVVAHASDEFMLDGIDSVFGQRFRDFEVIAVTEASPADAAGTSGGTTSRGVRTVRAGSGAQHVMLNAGLDAARGDYILFLGGNDVCAEGALRALAHRATQQQADLVIGGCAVLDSGEILPDANAEAIVTSPGYDRFDGRLLKSTALRNRLMRRAVIDREHLRFAGFGNCTEMAFTVAFALAAERIVTVPRIVSVRRARTLRDVAAATQDSTSELVGNIWEAFQMLEAEALAGVAALFPNGIDDAGRPTSHAATRYRNLLLAHEITELLTVYRDRAWVADDNDLAAIASHVRETSKVLQYNTWDQIIRQFPQLTVTDLPASRKEIAARPLVSVIAFGSSNQAEEIDDLIGSLLAQGFPRFEILVPATLRAELAPAHAALENLVPVDAGTDAAAFYQAGAKIARAGALLLTRAGVLYAPGALAEASEEMRRSRCDAVLWGSESDLPNLLVSVTHMSAIAGDAPEFGRTLAERIVASGFTVKAPVNRVVPRSSAPETGLPVVARTASTRAKPRSGLAGSLRLAKTAAKAMLSRKNIRLWISNVASSAFPLLPVSRKVFIYSPRSAGELKDNPRFVVDALSGVRKVVFTHLPPHPFRAEMRARYHMATAKVIVVDDYDTRYLAKMQLRPGQRVIQLWHACGAFKHFGMDSFTNRHDFEIETHRQYNAIVTSAEGVRGAYASAFAASIDRVQALGVPRTDFFFDRDATAAVRKRVLTAHPEFAGKQVILYAPTFREHLGDKTKFDSGIDFARLSSSLSENQIVAIRRHPVITKPILAEKTFPNVIEVSDVTTNELMVVADYLVTDYSTVIFDFSLLGKGFCLYCPDLQHYNRGFYFDFPNDIPVPFFSDPDALIDHLALGEFDGQSPALKEFMAGQMGACDGASSQRVADLIRRYADE